MVSGPINDDISNLIVAQLLFLESENPDKPVSISAPLLVFLSTICKVQTRALSSSLLQISMYINSPGGVVSSGLAIYDTMQVSARASSEWFRTYLQYSSVLSYAVLLQYIRSPISTLCLGQAASMASLLLCAGEKGKRMCLPHARVMLHQPSGGYQVQ